MPNILIKPSDELIELPWNSVLTILEEVNDNMIPFGCRAGACGACVVEVLEGTPNLTVANYMERKFLTSLGYPEECYRLACQCRLRGDITIRPIDR